MTPQRTGKPTLDEVLRELDRQGIKAQEYNLVSPWQRWPLDVTCSMPTQWGNQSEHSK